MLTPMRYVAIILLLFVSSLGISQGLKGKIKNQDNEPLPFTTIYIQELGIGTSSNADAVYELSLPKAGTYTVYYKYIGYETVVQKVIVENSFKEIDITLKAQTVLLKEVVATTKKSDPANWMMQRAIAKSVYYKQLIDEYNAQVYVKGKGKVTSIPFYLRGAFKKQDIDTSTLIIMESLSKVKFIRPNQYSEEVISVYASKKTDFNASPMPYIASSFYQEEVAGAISPLSQKAFKYYQFKYLGAYMDGDMLINKIKVIPKVKGPMVFQGELHLVEDHWAIYNLDLKAQIDYGIKIRVKQVYQLISEAAWMPINHQIDVNGGIMGVDFRFSYLASVSDYKVKLNPAIPKQVIIKDKEKEETKENKLKKEPVTVEKLISTKKDTVTLEMEQLKKLMDEYENRQQDSLAKLDIISVYNFKDDSASFTQDSSFWNKIRPIPLSEKEGKAYKKIDSISLKQAVADAADSLKDSKRGTFQFTDIITGGRYDLDSAGRSQFIIYNTLFNTNYNTVDGINLAYSLAYKYNLKSTISPEVKSKKDVSYYRNPYLLLKPTVRYSLARNKLNSKVLGKYRFQSGFLELSGGNYVSQFNQQEPISPLVNSGFTLLWEQNLMKLYERDFVSTTIQKKFSSKLFFNANLTLEKRYQLLNNSDFSFFDWDRSFTPNLPLNNEFYSDFDGQKAFTFKVNIAYTPFVKYVIRNDEMKPIKMKSSEFTLSYYKGIKGVFNSSVDFDRLEVGYRDKFDFGAKGMTFFNVKFGSFLNNRALGFMDYAHFPGNISFITQSDPVASYRLLDYYFYSTKNSYGQLYAFHQFRKLAITQVPAARFLGLKEALFLNYLETQSSNNYTEFGYSIGGILKLFRLEVVSNYEHWEYKGWGVRIGINVTLGNNVRIERTENE